MILLPKCVSKLAELASDDSGRSSMGGVLIEPPEEGHLWRLVATDGRKLAIVQGANEEGPGTATSEQTLKNLIGDGIEPGPCVVGGRDWKRMFALDDRAGDVLAVMATENQIAYALGGASGRVLALEGRYPDYRMVLPKRPPIFQLRLGAGYLRDICAAAMAVAEDKATPILIGIYGHGQPVTFQARNEGNFVTFDALLMPLTEPEIEPAKKP